MARTIDIMDVMDKDGIATRISDLFTSWENYRAVWVDGKREIREYLFATDTGDTTNASLPWKNKTHIPKLCQIRDNLHANYMSAMFPNENYLVWEGDTANDMTQEKRKVIQAYMANKLRQADFRTTVSQLLLDWIDYGNCFAMPEFVVEQHEDPMTSEPITTFIGPRLTRISPLDIVFDPTATLWENTPKIIRTLRTLGDIAAEIEEKPEKAYLKQPFERILKNRGALSNYRQSDFTKSNATSMDGFSSFFHYLQSDFVEELHFYGDFYDRDSQKLYKNYCISVLDRTIIGKMEPNTSWLGRPQIMHCGWRQRSDNLYAMGPLDNLVGMQYRIDHLENAKADAWDQFIHPMIKITGAVEDFDYAPGERIYADVDGNVDFMRPDVAFMQADTQIAMYEQKMEEMAGAPKQAMGFRTPGEKTKYEVQVLENGSNRVFLNKISYFEEKFLEPAVNAMLEISRRNMDKAEVVKVLDDETGAMLFETVTKEDITALGKIVPMGARHFVTYANIIQNLTQFYGSPVGQDPAVLAHISGKNVAKAMETLLEMEKFKIFQPNIRPTEQAETAQLAASLQQGVMETTGPAVQDGDPGGFPAFTPRG
jgi:hypothetical protein